MSWCSELYFKITSPAAAALRSVLAMLCPWLNVTASELKTGLVVNQSSDSAWISCWWWIMVNVTSLPIVPTAVQTLSDDLLKYYQQITRAILGEDPHLMKVSCCSGQDEVWAAENGLPAHASSLRLSDGSTRPSVKLQDCCPAAILRLRHQWSRLPFLPHPFV